MFRNAVDKDMRVRVARGRGRCRGRADQCSGDGAKCAIQIVGTGHRDRDAGVQWSSKPCPVRRVGRGVHAPYRTDTIQHSVRYRAILQEQD